MATAIQVEEEAQLKLAELIKIHIFTHFILLSSMMISLPVMANSYLLKMDLFSEDGRPLYSVHTVNVQYGPEGSTHETTRASMPFEINGQKVIPGMELVLETGESFIFREVLGYGFHTIIIRDSENRAIRLAQRIDARTMHMSEQYSESYFKLRHVVDGKYIVNMSNSQFRSIYTTVVEMVAIEMTLDQYLSKGINPADSKYGELLDFFVAFKRVKSLGGDFLPEQIGYVPKRGWVLFDYGPGVVISASGESSNFANNLIRNWPQYIEERSIEFETFEKLDEDIKRHQRQSVLNSTHNTIRSCRQIFALPF